jgi:hypothetical protein
MTPPIHTPGPVTCSFARYITDNEIGSPQQAAYNAFDSAGRKLGINAVEFAEQMQDGGIAELCEVLAKLLGDADHIMYHTPHLDADYFDQARAALAKVKGGAA